MVLEALGQTRYDGGGCGVGMKRVDERGKDCGWTTKASQLVSRPRDED